MWAANQREGGAKVLGIRDQASLMRWKPARRDALELPQAALGPGREEGGLPGV